LIQLHVRNKNFSQASKMVDAAIGWCEMQYDMQWSAIGISVRLLPVLSLLSAVTELQPHFHEAIVGLQHEIHHR
jgi:hypothetical protein